MADTFSNIDCMGEAHTGIPGLKEIRLPEGIELRDLVFLRSLMPCCAQLALPYWAKVVGKLINKNADDVLVHATITLYGDGGTMLSRHSDTLVIDAGDAAGFEVRLDEFHDKVEQYAITIEDAGRP